MRRTVLAAVAALGLVFAGNALATTYYVSSSGNDANAGTSTSAPWRSVSRVNSAALRAGDSVLFQGGSSFSGLLQPTASGAAGSAITFGSYGSGNANLSSGIQLASVGWLVFDGLTVNTGAWSTAGSVKGITTSASGTGAHDIVVRNSRFVNVALGLMLQSHLDQRWTVSNNLIQYTRDSGILVYDPNATNEIGGSNLTFDGNQILDTGLDPSITWYKHGVYSIGTDVTYSRNVISRFQTAGISIRGHNTNVVGNTISDGPYAIGWSPYDTTRGTTRIQYNKLTGATVDSIEINYSGQVPSTVENFVVSDNTIVPAASGQGMRVLGTTGFVKIANNVIVLGNGNALRVDATPGGGLVERNDLWFRAAGAPSFIVRGTTYSGLASYQSGTGQGTGDVSANPLLDASFVPGAGSPVIDAGTGALDSSYSYVGDCSGALFHYCGSAVDLGATEAGAAAPVPPAPLAPPSGLVASSVTTGSVDLAWTASTDPRVVSYSVSANGKTVATTQTTVATVSGLACGTSYAFAVVGLDSAGNASTAATATASTAACSAPLAPPSALTATGVTATGLSLSWTASSDARVVSYRVTAGGTTLGTTSATSYAVGGLACGTQYAFAVVGLDAAGNASAAATTAATTASCADTTPPSVQITSPLNGQTVSRSFTITASASDAGGIGKVIFWYDNATRCEDTTAPYTSCTFKVSRGGHTIAARAVDRAGNTTTVTAHIWAN